MAKYTLEEIMYGDKYGIESAVFVEVFKMVEQKVDPKTIREQLNMIYVKHTLLTAKRIIEEGDSISDIPELESLSLRKIPLDDLRWYAAFHNKDHHPHIHMLVYSASGGGFLTTHGIEQMKSCMVREIFRDELYHLYEDIFIARGIRFIAIDDGVDTYLNGYQQIATFKNMYNAMYPRDISEKTRSAYKTKSESGWFLGSKAPYGYQKDPKYKHHLIIDEEVAHIVRHIFDLAKQGYGKRKITKILHEEKIPTPAAYAKAQGMNHYFAMTAHDDECYWCDDTVGDMLINEVYIGNMVNHRKEKPFKSKKFRDVPKDGWIVVENTHEPIIDKQTFDEVQKLLESRARETKTGETQIFAKIIKCMDCKKALVFSNATKSYVCNTYNLKGKQYCPSHYIRYDELYGVVLADIYTKTMLLETDRDSLYKAALKCNEQKIMAETKDNQRKLAKANKRIGELELLIKKTYENSVLGNLSSERMASLLAGYEEEQAELKAEASRIEGELSEYHKSKDNAIDFVNLIEKYEYQGETYQDINIYYKFVGTVEFNSELNIEKAG